MIETQEGPARKREIPDEGERFPLSRAAFIVDANLNPDSARSQIGRSLALAQRPRPADAQLGQPEQRFSFSYDHPPPPPWTGDLLATPGTTNHVGRVYRVYDGAGVATTVAFDFKGHATSEQRQLVSDKTTQTGVLC